MGLFPFAGTISSMLNLSRSSAACGRWPEGFWRRSALAMHPCRSVPALQLSAFSRLTHHRSLSHPPASNHRPACRAIAPRRRWMLPTVERGPPVLRPAQRQPGSE